MNTTIIFEPFWRFFSRNVGIIDYYRKCRPRSSYIQLTLSELFKNVREN